MSLQPSQRLLQYEVLALIGTGGMGEVYRAHDTKLGREVATKVLPENFASDPERLSRFEREAAICASEVRFPAVPLECNRLRRIGQCFSPGPTIVT